MVLDNAHYAHDWAIDNGALRLLHGSVADVADRRTRLVPALVPPGPGDRDAARRSRLRRDLPRHRRRDVDDRTDAVPVVLGEHAEVGVAEEIGDEFDRDALVDEDGGGGVA